MSRNYIRGQSEAISKVYIGQVADSSNQFLRRADALASGYNSLVLFTSDGIGGYTEVPSGSYDPAVTTDEYWTAEEAVDKGGTGATIYSQFQILNPAYQGVDLFADFNQFGTYSDNDALSDFLPETDWKPDVDYTTIGQRVRFGGLKYVNYVSSNEGNIPVLSPDKWLAVPLRYELMQKSAAPMPMIGALTPFHDRAHADYQQNILVDEFTILAEDYATYLVHLDAATLTGDLATIMTDYHSLAMFTDGGDMIDLGDYIPTPQSVGGDSDTMAELVLDQFQGHWHTSAERARSSVDSASYTTISDISAGTPSSSDIITDPITDGVNGTPRTGSTTHGKRFTTGAAYIYVTKKL